MRVVISARHTHLSEKVKRYAQEKVGKLERFDESVTQAELVLSSESHGKRPPLEGERAEKHQEISGDVGAAELIVSVARGHAPFVARADGENVYAAVDLVVDKMERQLRRHREKLKDRHRQPRC